MTQRNYAKINARSKVRRSPQLFTARQYEKSDGWREVSESPTDFIGRRTETAAQTAVIAATRRKEPPNAARTATTRRTSQATTRATVPVRTAADYRTTQRSARENGTKSKASAPSARPQTTVNGRATPIARVSRLVSVTLARRPAKAIVGRTRAETDEKPRTCLEGRTAISASAPSDFRLLLVGGAGGCRVGATEPTR